MKERGIIFSAPMIRAILAGTKSQTRRIVNPQPVRSLPHEVPLPGGDGTWVIQHPVGWRWRNGFAADEAGGVARVLEGQCPYGAPRDRLVIREKWATHADEDRYFRSEKPWSSSIYYAADWAFRQNAGPNETTYVLEEDMHINRWRPSIHMPKWASRTTLEITDVRVQRLRDISEEDAQTEGVVPFFERFQSIGRDQRLTTGELAADAEHRASFAVTWDEINGSRSTWKDNAFVWALTFRRVT